MKLALVLALAVVAAALVGVVRADPEPENEDDTPATKAVKAFEKLQEAQAHMDATLHGGNKKGKPQPPKALPKLTEPLKVPIPMARIHDPFLLKPIHSVFKCDRLLDKTQIARCTECFRKGGPAPWEVIAFQANNGQCRLGHEIIPVSLLDAGIAARFATAEQLQAADAEEDEEEAGEESEDETEDEADDESEDESEDEADEEDMALVQVADEDEEEAEDEEEVDDEAAEELFNEDEEAEFEAQEMSGFLELAHSKIDAAFAAFRADPENYPL